MIIGSRPEPFFSSCLASIEEAVDFLVLNDNSGDPDNPNLIAFRNSKLYRESKTTLIQSDLKKLSGFDEARNLCLQETGRRFPDQDVWILYVDSDEVHTPKLRDLTRGLIPKLSLKFGVVDGYFYQFIQSFDYYYTMDRRHNMLVRYRPEIHWKGGVHEKICGISGNRVPTGYLFFHYGYLFTPENVLNRWKLYKHYDGVPYDPDALTRETVFSDFLEKRIMIPFKGSHPSALAAYHKEGHDERHLTRFTEALKKNLARSPIRRALARLRSANWKLRLLFRTVQAMLINRVI